MILTIFILFSAIAFLLTLTGYYLKQNMFIVFGLLIFALLSFPLLYEDLENKTGTKTLSNYTYDNNSLMNSSSENLTYIYENVSNTRWYGIFYLFICLGAFFDYFTNKRKSGDDD